MDDDEKIYTAIRNADKAGDVESVRKLSAYLKTRAAPQADDPLAAAKKAIAEGRAAGSPEDVARDMAAAPADKQSFGTPDKGHSMVDDVKEFADNVGRGAARIKGNLTGDKDATPIKAEEVGRPVSNFIRNVTAPFGGDYVAAAGSALTGKGFNPDEQRAEREALTAENPVTAVAGNLLGVGGLGKLVGARVGQGAFANGATTGGIAGAATSEDPLVGGIRGAAEGGVLGKGAEGATKVVGNVANVVKNRDIPKSVRALANRLQIKPAQLVQDKADMEAAAGHPISWGQAADPQTVERFRALQKARPEMGEVAGEARTAADEARPADTAALVRAGGPEGTAEGAEQARTVTFSQMMGRQANKPVDIPPDSGLNSPTVRSTIKGLKADVQEGSPEAADIDTLMDAVASGRGGTVPLKVVESVRKRIADILGRDPGRSGELGPVRDSLRAMGEASSPAYASAMRTFERLGDYGQGITQGSAAAAPGAVTRKLLDRKILPNGREQDNGIAVGFRTQLASDLENANGALPEAQVSTGMQRRATEALGPAEAERVASGLKAEIKAGRNMARLDTSPNAELADHTGAIIAARLAGVGGGRNLGGLLDIVATKTWGALRGLGLSNEEARAMARDLYSKDSVKNAEVAEQLQRFGIGKGKTDVKAVRNALLAGRAGAVLGEDLRGRQADGDLEPIE